MTRFTKKYLEKVGLLPGALVHIGKDKKHISDVTLIEFDQNHYDESTIDITNEKLIFKTERKIKWLNIDGVHQTDLIESIGQQFNIHSLTLGDIVNTEHRPKIEDFGEYLFLVLKMIGYDLKSKRIVIEQVSFVIGEDFLITFQEMKGDLFEPVRNRLREGIGKIRKMGSDYLAYTIIDTIVDNYFVVLEILGERIESIEDELLKNPSNHILEDLHKVKREMIYLRRSVWPLREIISTMQKGETKLIHNSTLIYLKDIYDHTIQVIDTIEVSRDMLSSMMDVYMSSVSNKMNQIMKVLTIIATFFMPLTFIAGVYGMNFQYMPELHWRYGYPAALGLMLIVSSAMILYFYKKKWF